MNKIVSYCMVNENTNNIVIIYKIIIYQITNIRTFKKIEAKGKYRGYKKIKLTSFAIHFQVSPTIHFHLFSWKKGKRRLNKRTKYVFYASISIRNNTPLLSWWGERSDNGKRKYFQLWKDFTCWVANKNNTKKELPSSSSAIEPVVQEAACWAGMKAHGLPVECGF